MADIVRLLRSDLAGPVDIGSPHETSVVHIAGTVRHPVGGGSEMVFVLRPGR